MKFAASSLRIRSVCTLLVVGALTLLALTVGPGHDAGAQSVPNDPQYSSEWALQKIAAPQAWDLTQGSTTVKVAVVSTGVVSTLTDLQGQIGPGYNAVSPGGGTQDDFGTYGDGTAAAGIIGAATNNATDMAAVSWHVTLLPVKVCDLTGTCPNAAIAAGINWAVSNGAQVINVGVALNPTSASPDIDAAVANAVSRGVLVVASAGNYAGYVGYPANLSGVIAVGATDSTDTVASFSGRGAQLGLVAPGVSVMSLARQGCCIAFTSAEFAAAHVSGALALLLSAGVPAGQAGSFLYRGADDFGAAGWDSSYGWGRLNVCGALAAAGIGCPSSGATSTVTPTRTNTPTATRTATAMPTATNTPLPTATNSPTPSATSLATNTPTPTATNTLTPTTTNTATPTPTNTFVPTATSQPPATATATPTTSVTTFFSGRVRPSVPSSDVGISLVGGRRVTATLTWTGAATLQLCLYSPTGALLTQVSSGTGQATLTYVPATSGQYDLRVILISGGKTNYSLSVTS